MSQGRVPLSQTESAKHSGHYQSDQWRRACFHRDYWTGGVREFTQTDHLPATRHLYQSELDGGFSLTLSKSGNDQLPINDLEHRWPISIIIAVGVDQISIRGCLLYLIEYAATFTFYTILSNTNQTIRDMTIFRCRPNKDLLISVFLITPLQPNTRFRLWCSAIQREHLLFQRALPML